MKRNQNLYEYLHQVLTMQFLNGTFQQGQKFPSQKELCRQYNVGITTVRKVMKMLDEQGYIHTAQGQPTSVTYHASVHSRAAYLVQRQEEIADAYRGLELLMPALYCEGAKECKEAELKNLRGIIDSVSEQMELPDLYRQANTFFTALLRPLKNQLIIDLELDSENYLHVPHIPFLGVKDPFALTADKLKSWLQNAIFLIEKKQFKAFRNSCARLYRETGKRVDDYLSALRKHTSAVRQINEDVSWFRIKGRSELYAQLAMTLIRRIVSGEFDEQKYLPSIPKIMEEYGVMKNTASRAVALLNSLGLAQTVDKKGSVVAVKGMDSIRMSNLDLVEPVIQDRLSLFKDALQIVALASGSCATSFSSVPENLAPFMEERLRKAPDGWISPLSFQLLMGSFIQLLPHHSLKNIFRQLEELIIWGHYLQTVNPSFYPDPADTAAAANTVVTALKEKNYSELPDAFGNAFSLIYRDVNAVMAQVLRII